MFNGALLVTCCNAMTEGMTLHPRERLAFLALMLLFDTATQAPVPRSAIAQAAGIANNHFSEVLASLKEKELVVIKKGVSPNPSKLPEAFQQLVAIEKALQQPSATSGSDLQSAVATLLAQQAKRVPKKARKKRAPTKNFRDAPLGTYETPEAIAIGYEWFDYFWKLYPRKVKKERCKKLFMKIVYRDKIHPQKLIDGLQRAIENEFDKVDEARYVADPLHWLEEKRWEDEY